MIKDKMFQFIFSRKAGFILSLSGFLLCQVFIPLGGATEASKGTNVQIDSSELEPFSLDKKTEPKEKKPVFYKDDKVALDLNENSEPNLNMRF